MGRGNEFLESIGKETIDGWADNIWGENRASGVRDTFTSSATRTRSTSRGTFMKSGTAEIHAIPLKLQRTDQRAWNKIGRVRRVHMNTAAEKGPRRRRRNIRVNMVYVVT